MRKIVQFMHVSLDGFIAGPKGEMDWIYVDDDIFRFGHERIKNSDAAMYGRNTWKMMDDYWPTAAEQPNAGWHAIEHGKWYNQVDKFVISRTMKSDPSKKVTVIGSDLMRDVNNIKNSNGGEILIFGSPSAGHALAQLGLVDEYWLFVNPILIGQGIPMFSGLKNKVKLKLTQSHAFKSGVVCLGHEKIS